MPPPLPRFSNSNESTALLPFGGGGHSNTPPLLPANEAPSPPTKRSSTNKDCGRLPHMTISNVLNVAMLVCSTILLLMARYEATSNHQQSMVIMTAKNDKEADSMEYSTNSKYTQVQGMGFQIYTGGAPAFLGGDTTAATATATATATTKRKANPECIGLQSYGSMWTEEGETLQCYVGNDDPKQDVQNRLTIMKAAVELAYDTADPDPSTLKIFIAPEFYWRGVDGAYLFEEEAPGDPSICGPVCQILVGLEDYVAQARFSDWLFLFGSITAAEPVANQEEAGGAAYDSLFYNFAPIYRGYDPDTSSHVGNRFIAPKRYLSTSDFMTPQRHLNVSNFKELIDMVQPLAESSSSSGPTRVKQNSTVINPSYTRGKYDNDIWSDYKEELDGLGYTLLSYGWLMVDGLSISLEICLDHQMKAALTSYIADITTGRNTLIPSTSSDRDGLEYVPIPSYQAQIGIVSSAGMTVTQESLALTNHGTIFLQDGLSNVTNRMYWSNTGCELGLQFEGGTEAVQRRAFLSSTDIFFEHKALEGFTRYNVFDKKKKGGGNAPSSSWETSIHRSFSTKVYPPQLTVFDPVAIAQVPRSANAIN